MNLFLTLYFFNITRLSLTCFNKNIYFYINAFFYILIYFSFNYYYYIKKKCKTELKFFEFIYIVNYKFEITTLFD